MDRDVLAEALQHGADGHCCNDTRSDCLTAWETVYRSALQATPQPEAGLDVAWAEAEAALPEGYGFGVTKTVNVRSGPYVATTDFGSAQRGYAYGPTPVAALRALADELRESKP